MKPAAGRQKRLVEQIQAQLMQLLLTQARDKDLASVFINRVSVSADLSVARVYFGSYGEIKQAQKALDRAAGFLRSELANHLSMRRVPRLYFSPDENLARLDEIEKLLQPTCEEAGKP